MLVKDLISAIEELANPALQESYDNTGLIIGNPLDEVSSVLLTIDVTEDVIAEALEKKANMIICHHPVIFNGIKKITGKTYTERIIIRAVQNKINIFAAHTNLDAVDQGVNSSIARKLNLENTRILSPVKEALCKLVTFIPPTHEEQVREAVFAAGAGHIGNYDSCGYTLEGKGSFRGGDDTNPFLGEKGVINYEKEVRFETIFPYYLQNSVVNALNNAHPYEEVAYDVYPLKNTFERAGMGMIGDLKDAVTEADFLYSLKQKFNAGCVRHTALLGKMVKKVAFCGGSGSFLINNAINKKADVFITADVKYHQFFDADGKIIVADIGHFESEQFTTEIFYDILTKKFSNFAVHFSEVNTNPINYL